MSDILTTLMGRIGMLTIGSKYSALVAETFDTENSI